MTEDTAWRADGEFLILFGLYQDHLNVLTFPPPDWGMLRRSRCIQIFFKHFKKEKLR